MNVKGGAVGLAPALLQPFQVKHTYLNGDALKKYRNLH